MNQGTAMIDTNLPGCVFCSRRTANALGVCRRCLDRGLVPPEAEEVDEPVVEREAAVCVRVANPVEIG